MRFALAVFEHEIRLSHIKIPPLRQFLQLGRVPVELDFHCGIVRLLVLVVQFVDSHREQLSHAGVDTAEIDPQNLLPRRHERPRYFAMIGHMSQPLGYAI